MKMDRYFREWMEKKSMMIDDSERKMGEMAHIIHNKRMDEEKGKYTPIVDRRLTLKNIIYLSLALLYIEYLFEIIDDCPCRKHGLNCLCLTLILLRTIFVIINISFKFQ
jgi:hypothetical protein